MAMCYGSNTSLDDSPHMPRALSTVRGLQWSPSIYVRPIMTLDSSWDSSLDATQNLEALGCGKWIWRIAEQATTSKACKDSIWISEILPRGPHETTGLAERHDARANVSDLRVLKLISQIELLSRPQELFEPEGSYNSLKSHFDDEWQLGFLSHAVPFVSLPADA